MAGKPLLRILAILLGIVSAFMALCLAAGFLMGEGDRTLRAFAIPVGIGAAGLALAWIGKVTRRRISLPPRDGFLFVALAWVFASALGALPFTLAGTMSYVDAFFETISGFTTTGASILSDIEVIPKSLLLWRSTTHWLGGMGIVVLTVAILPLLGVGGLGLMEAEAPGPSVDKITPRISSTAKILWLIYVALTVLEILLLMAGGMDWFDAVTHTFGTMATGGFSTKNLSVGHYRSGYIDVVITVFMLAAGLNFSLYFKLLSGKAISAFRDTEARTYLGIFSVAALLIAWDLWRAGTFGGFGASLRYAGFQASSIITTTGFATADFAKWPPLSQTILFLLMFVGGCAGSTGGGIKVIRIVFLSKMAFTEMKYLLNPRGIYGIFVDGKSLRKNIIYDTAAFVLLYIFLLLATTLVVSAGGFDILTSLTASLATVGNIGPGFGKVGPAFNYGFFPDWIKLWLSFAMLAGRLEIYTIFILFTRAFWRR
ncbi:MAG TPA: TrkH family potassium uptake protein [Spirochaetia bacterium]|nr:TrkH family potassium uptake protein [Spirochaetales bacterium]HRY80748.1 TrkH family potassium uptake protein [Spirochaetia bacterium]HRZ88328.1 TrkH family potassium uptake protein [Spirochaetia bacterium]